MGRHANPDIRRAFQEFNDTDTPSKCNKVRCLHCGFVRAKNTTRQIEHLQECQAYQASPEAHAHALALQEAGGDGSIPPHSQQAGTPNILNGQAPNPNLQVHRRGPNQKRARDGQLLAPHHPMGNHPAPSLTAHLLHVCSVPFTTATQQGFLMHAGSGTLAQEPLQQWLVQDGHYSRGYIRFVGQLLAKIRLPSGTNTQFHPMYRTMDLLISALNNMRREMQFFDITAAKYNLAITSEPPTPITRALLDLFVSASSTSASLLEGMIVLWGTEHCYRSSWQFASSYTSSLTSPSNDPHIMALHQALIPNWTAPAFSKFIDATRGLVDELANTTTARDGKEEMMRCEEIFRQICWLEERFWPEVDGMGRLINGNHNDRDDDDLEDPMNGQMNPSQMNSSGLNGPTMNGPGMNGSGMNGPINAPMNNQINNPMNNPMNNQMNNSMNNGEGTPVGDGRNSFGGLEGVGQSS